MATVKIQLKYDDNRTRMAQAQSAKVESGVLILRDTDGDEVGRFNMDRIESWWIEPGPTT
jgi:hypothetical protein